MGNIGVTGALSPLITNLSTQSGQLEMTGLALYAAAQALNGLWDGTAHDAFEQTMLTLNGDLNQSNLDLVGMIQFLQSVQNGYGDLNEQARRMFTLQPI